MAMLGKAAGRYVHAVANNRDHRPVRRRRGRRSFGAQRALGRGAARARRSSTRRSRDLAERLTRRMERKRRAGRTVVLRLRFGDYTRATPLVHARPSRPPTPARSPGRRASCSTRRCRSSSSAASRSSA